MVNGTLLCKILWILPRDERHRHRPIIYLEQKDIQESAEVHLPVLLGTLQMQWQRHLRLCCQMAQIVSNTTTRKLNIGVKNVNTALRLNIAEDIESDSDSFVL